MNQILKDIPGYEGLYSITRDGNLWGNKRNKWCKPSLNSKKYLQFGLCKNGIKKSSKIHRLVALTYMPNSYNYPEVNHINGIKADNRIENLEWCTHEENMHHAWKNGLNHNNIILGNKTNTNPLNKSVECIETGIIYHSAMEAQRQTRIKQSQISSCCLNKYGFKTAGKFTWRYI